MYVMYADPASGYVTYFATGINYDEILFFCRKLILEKGEQKKKEEEISI